MDDNDLAQILQRLRGILRGLQQSETLSTYYRERRVVVESYSFTLTAAQRATVQTQVDTVTTRILTAVNSLEALTGAVGAADAKEVGEIAAAPPRINTLIGNALQSGQQILGSIPVDLSAGGASDYTFDAKAAQMTANSLATIKEGVILVVAIIRARTNL